MIPKLICLIFGHIYTVKDFGSQRAIQMDKITGEGGWYENIITKNCPRCGAKLI